MSRALKTAAIYLLLTAGALGMLFPFLWMLSTSLKVGGNVLKMPPELVPHPLSFANFAQVAEIFPMGRVFANSVFVSVTATLGQVLVAALAAYAFARLKWRWREGVFLAYLATLMIPQQVTLIPQFIEMRFFGWINTYQALILPGMFSAFGVFLLRQFFLTLPAALSEAAFVDGASHRTVFWRIVLPLARPPLAALTVLAFMANWNSFLWPLVVTTRPELMTLPLGLATLQGRYYTEWNLVMAGAVLNVLPMILAYLFAQKQLVQGVTLSGIKG